jgi:hypothetical protein
MRDEMAVLERERTRGREIDSTEEDFAECVAAGNSIARLVRERRIDWDAAVDQIGEINHGRVGFLMTLRAVHPHARTERELYAAYLRAKIKDLEASPR